MFFSKHIFVCTNERGDPCRKSCGDTGAGASAAQFLSDYVRGAGVGGKGGVRVSRSGCLGRCAAGPLLVVYPQGHWYAWRTEDDLRRIAQYEIEQSGCVDDLRC